MHDLGKRQNDEEQVRQQHVKHDKVIMRTRQHRARIGEGELRKPLKIQREMINNFLFVLLRN